MGQIDTLPADVGQQPIDKGEPAGKKWKTEFVSVFWSTLILVIFGLLTFLFLQVNSNKTVPLIDSVYRYRSPEWGMGLLSVLIVSLGWLLAWFLFYTKFVKEISIFGLSINISPNTPKLLWFVFGLPPTVLIVSATLSILGLIILPTTCEIPGIIFTVRAGNAEAKEYTPESEAIIERSASSIVYLKSYPSDDNTASIGDDLDCQFRAEGEVVDRIDTPFRRSCLTTIYLKQNLPGRIVVKADVKARYCDISSSYNLSILVK